MARLIGRLPFGSSVVGRKPGTGPFIMGVTILVLGFYLIYPVVLLLIMSFNTARDVLVGPAEWGFGNWIDVWQRPLVREAIQNSFIVWFFTAAISFPIAITISLILARTKVPFSYGLEYGFWVAYMFPTLATTIGWMLALDPHSGILNQLLVKLPFIDESPFNIFSLEGIIWAKVMGDGIAYKVMLFTPAFRNMDAALEEASRVSGRSSVSTMMRVTLPVMASPIMLVVALQLIRVMSGFETEWILGSPWGFFVHSTLIFSLVSQYAIPQYGQAIGLASITLLIIGVIIPLQRWIVHRRHYTTVSATFRPGLIDPGPWKWVFFGAIAFVLILLTAAPFVIALMGTFMVRVGFFNTIPLWTLDHWQLVLTDPQFLRALRTTAILAVVAGVGSPVLFSVIAYMLVRTRLPGRRLLDTIVWISAAFPGIISGFALLLMFLSTPGLSWLYGSIWALIIVVIIQGNTTGTNIFKGVMVQLGPDLEEAARVAGAGWLRTYFRIVIPVLAPTMILIGTLNFVSAASTTSGIILLASRDTMTLSILGLTLATDAGGGEREAAGVVALIIMALTLGIALIARTLGLGLGVRHDMRER